MENLKALREALVGLKGDTDLPFSIHCQDNPDPDAIGSAYGMQYVLKCMGYKSEIYYGGQISHPQNRALKNAINVQLHTHDTYLVDKFCGRIFVDVTSEGCKNMNTFAHPPDIVYDHHDDRPSGKVALEVIEAIGATATMVGRLLFEAIIDHEECGKTEEYKTVCSALLLAIITDTKHLTSSNTTSEDISAHNRLYEECDRVLLQEISRYPVQRSYYDALAKGLESFEIKGSDGCAYLGYLPRTLRDYIPMVADELNRMEGITTVMVVGFIGGKEDRAVASLRSSNATVDLNELCHHVFGDENSGAKKGEGGASVSIGPLVSSLKEDEKIPLMERFYSKFKDNFFSSRSK